MSAGVPVDPDALDAHARQVTAIADRIGQATAAARPPGVESYGQIGYGFGMAVVAASASGSEAVAGVAELVSDCAAAVRSSADAYRRVEERISTGLGGPR